MNVPLQLLITITATNLPDILATVEKIKAIEGVDGSNLDIQVQALYDGADKSADVALEIIEDSKAAHSVVE